MGMQWRTCIDVRQQLLMKDQFIKLGDGGKDCNDSYVSHLGKLATVLVLGEKDSLGGFHVMRKIHIVVEPKLKLLAYLFLEAFIFEGSCYGEVSESINSYCFACLELLCGCIYVL